MMIEELGVEVLGDPHMGRKFRTGVPLHRVGEREEMQWEQLEQSLMNTEAAVHVCMGDIFDTFTVSPEIVLRVFHLYSEACARNQAQYILIRGNHDVSRNQARASSFDLLVALARGLDNLWIVDDEPVIWGSLGFIPYHPFRPTTELLEELLAENQKVEAIFGHWDVVDFGGDNVIPTKQLSDAGITLAITGHDHVAREEKRDGVNIIVTGSMQPYTHAEDPDQRLYITMPLEDLPLHDLTKMNVRVLLREGEVLPTDLDCLSLTGKRLVEDEDIETSMEEFDGLDLDQQLANALEGNPVAETILQFFQEVRHA